MLKRILSLAASSLLIVLTGAVYVTPAAAQKPDAQRVEVVVAHKAGAAGAVRAAIAKADGSVVAEMDEVNAIVVNVPLRAVDALRHNPNVEFVEEGVPRRLYSERSPRVKATLSGQVTPYGIAMVQADQVSDALASNRKLCIVDSGIDAAHEDLGGIPMTGEDFTGSGSPFTDEDSHGTHVAGTAAARDNGIGVIGVAPHGQLNLHIAKVFDASGEASSIIIARAMLSCLRNGANVVSMSLGGGPSKIEEAVANVLAKRNLLLIAAAGNDGDSTISYPAGYASVVSVAAIDSSMAWAGFSQFNADVELAAPGVGVLSSVPPALNSAATLTVGASSYAVIAMEGTLQASLTAPLADFATGEVPVPGSMSGKVCLIQRGNISFADKVLNCQNSGGVGAVIYNNVAGQLFGTLGGTATTIPSVGALAADGAAMLGQIGQAATLVVTHASYLEFDGTSMATPHVSAVAALVWSHHTGCTAAQMRDSLNKSALDLGPAGRDDKFGFGLVQAKAALDRIATLGCGL